MGLPPEQGRAKELLYRTFVGWHCRETNLRLLASDIFPGNV
jgi:hypothetical protein